MKTRAKTTRNDTIISTTSTGLNSSLGMLRAVCSRSDNPRRAMICRNSIRRTPVRININTVNAADA